MIPETESLKPGYLAGRTFAEPRCRDYRADQGNAALCSNATGRNCHGRMEKLYRPVMNPSVYIETTIPSYLTAWPSRDIVRAAHQQLTREWWDQRRGAFSLHVSQIVLDEAGAGNAEAAAERLKTLAGIPLLTVPDETGDLASLIMQRARLPEKAATDALHIAVAAWHGMDFLMTWNCTHINNAQLLPLIERTCREAGCSCPVICTPEELMML